MRTKLLTLVVLSFAVSCAPLPSALTIQRIYEVALGCDIKTYATEGAGSSGGLLDVAPGTPMFFVGVHIGGGLTYAQQSLSVGNAELERENRNRPLIRQQIATYRFGAGTRLNAAPYVTEFALAPDTAGDIFTVAQLISPDLGQALFDALPPSNALEDTITLFVDLEYTGIMSGTGNTFTTGKMTYPITVFRSTGNVCTPPANSPLVDSCMYRGQSASVVKMPVYSCPPPAP